VQANPNPYTVLGVPHHATDEQIKRRFRQAVRECHPDLGDEPERTETFKAVTWAYRLLSDPLARAAFDAGLDVKIGDEEEAPRPTEARESADAPRKETREMLGRALSSLSEGAFGDAENLARLVLRRERDNADAYVLIAEAMVATGRRTEALGCLNLALQIAPGHVAAQRALQRLRSPGDGSAAETDMGRAA
jgi:molecular chaperone DnaJ